MCPAFPPMSALRLCRRSVGVLLLVHRQGQPGHMQSCPVPDGPLTPELSTSPARPCLLRVPWRAVSPGQWGPGSSCSFTLTEPLTENTVRGTFWKHQQGHWFLQPPRSGSTITRIELGRKAREQERATRAVPTRSSHSQGPGCCVPRACGQRALVWLSS